MRYEGAVTNCARCGGEIETGNAVRPSIHPDLPDELEHDDCEGDYGIEEMYRESDDFRSE